MYLLMLIDQGLENLRNRAKFEKNANRNPADRAQARFRTLSVVPLSASIFFCSNMIE
jgi:hypothetical protein